MKNQRTIAWVLILVTAFYIMYHAWMNGAFGASIQHTYVFIAAIVWLIGDYLLSGS